MQEKIKHLPIFLKPGYGHHLHVHGLTPHEAALYDPKTYQGLDTVKRKFGINFKKHPFVPLWKRGETPLLNVESLTPSKEGQQRLKYMYRAIVKKTDRKTENAIPKENCYKGCQRPAQVLAVPQGDKGEFFFEQREFYCSDCWNKMIQDIRFATGYFGVTLSLDAWKEFPVDERKIAQRIIRKAYGFSSKKMSRKERRDNCKIVIDSAPEWVNEQGYFLNPNDVMFTPKPLAEVPKRRKKVKPKITEEINFVQQNLFVLKPLKNPSAKLY